MHVIKILLMGRKEKIDDALINLRALPGVQAVEGAPTSSMLGSILSRDGQPYAALYECAASIIFDMSSLAGRDTIENDVMALLNRLDVMAGAPRDNLIEGG